LHIVTPLAETSRAWPDGEASVESIACWRCVHGWYRQRGHGTTQTILSGKEITASCPSQHHSASFRLEQIFSARKIRLERWRGPEQLASLDFRWASADPPG
jgi:hypothetical protein